MPAPRPSFIPLRFAPARPIHRIHLIHLLAETDIAQTEILAMPREEGLDLLDCLGLGRPEFGAISARELAPRCRRKLWNVVPGPGAAPMPLLPPALRARSVELLALAEAAGEGMVLFG